MVSTWSEEAPPSAPSSLPPQKLSWVLCTLLAWIIPQDTCAHGSLSLGHLLFNSTAQLSPSLMTFEAKVNLFYKEVMAALSLHWLPTKWFRLSS